MNRVAKADVGFDQLEYAPCVDKLLLVPVQTLLYLCLNVLALFFKLVIFPL